MDGLAELINEEEAVYGLAYEGRESLVGKTIKHRCMAGESGMEKWYFAEVLSKVAGSNECMVAIMCSMKVKLMC